MLKVLVRSILFSAVLVILFTPNQSHSEVCYYDESGTSFTCEPCSSYINKVFGFYGFVCAGTPCEIVSTTNSYQWGDNAYITDTYYSIVRIFDNLALYTCLDQVISDTPPPTPTPNPDPDPSPPPSPTPQQQARIDVVNACVQQASVINIDEGSLGESIAVVGAPFSIEYTSERFRSNDFDIKALGLGGWIPSLVHHYDHSKKEIYFGTSGLRKIEGVPASGGYYVASESGNEVYYFDSSGRHTQTREGLTGSVKFNITYDSSGRIASISDQFSNISTFAYSIGQVTITSPYGKVTIINLDSNGFLAAVKNPNNEVTTATMNSSGYLTSFKKPNGQPAIFTYDANGYLSKDAGAFGNSITLSRVINAITGTQNVTSSTSLDRRTHYEIFSNTEGAKHNVRSASGQTMFSQNIYRNQDLMTDSLGHSNLRVVSADARFGWMSPISSSASQSIAGSSLLSLATTQQTANLSDPTDPFSIISLETKTILQNDSARTFTSNYNGSSRTLTSTSAEGRISKQILNSNGLTSNVQNGSQEPVNFNYDSRGRLSRILNGNRNVDFAYDSSGNVARITDALGRSTKFEYDAIGKVTKQIRPDQKAVQFNYDSNGNMTGITPVGKPKHQFTYNLLDFIQSYLPPGTSNSGSTTYEYNLDKQLTKIHRPDGKNINFNYHATRGTLDSIQVPNGQYIFNYITDTELLSSSTSPDGNICSYQYMGRLPISEDSTVSGKISYGYQNDFLLDTITIADKVGNSNSISLDYDKDNLLKSIGDINFARNDFGAIKSSQIGNLKENISYNNFGEMVSDKYKFNNKDLYNLALNRDSLGRIASVNENGHKISYKYDKLGRLIAVNGNWKEDTLYKYDDNGNRIAKISWGQWRYGVYDEEDRLINYGPYSYSYNYNGELIEKAEHKHECTWDRHRRRSERIASTKYEYDAFGNLKKVVLPKNKVIEYVLDAQDRRIARKVNGVITQRFLYQSQTQIAAELDGSGRLVKRFVYGSKPNIPDYMIKGGVNYRIISDQVGSVRLVVNTSTGAIAQRIDYDDFGVVSQDSSPGFQPFGFAGGLTDRDTGLIHFGRRDYDPESGRFTTRDPILFDGGDTNLFGYVANDPVNWIDPEGLYKYSPTAGEPVNTETGNAMACFEKCLGGPELTITGAKEGGHAPGSAHETGQACDVSEKKNPGVTTDPKLNSCFQECFPQGSWGQIENNPPHVHVQTRPGKGGSTGFKK